MSLMTLRQALDKLCDDGVVEQLPGKGTYVKAPPVPYSMGNLRSLADDLRRQGIEVFTRVLSTAMTPVPGRYGSRFQNLTDGEVLRLERIRIINGAPLIHQVSYVPQPFADLVVHADFETQELYTILADQAAAVPFQAEETIAPIQLPEDIGELLGLPAGRPAMRSERITGDAEGRTLVVDVAVLAGDSIVITNVRKAGGHQVSYAMHNGERHINE